MTKVQLKKITTKIGSGATPSGGQSAYEQSGISLIRSQNVHDFTFLKNGLAFINENQANNLNNVTVLENDILLNITGDSIARVCKVPKEILPARVNQHVAIIRANKNVDSNYLLCYLQFLKPYLLKICGVGGTRNALTKDVIEKLLIELPDLGTQNNIGQLIENINSKIELNNRINTELEQMAKTIYDYWFVQFDFPMSAEYAASVGQPELEGKPYKSSGGRMVWSVELKREVPEGWEVKLLSDWIEISKSGDWGKESQEGNYTEKVYCFRGADINGLNGLSELKPPTRYILEKNKSKILEANDLIVEISGGSPTQSTGRMAFITNATLKRFDLPVICSNFCKPISLINKKLLYNFAYYWNSLYDNGIFFGYEGKTSGIKNLLFDSFVTSFFTVVPENKIVDKFYNLMEDINNKKQNNLAENQKLIELRDWLLPMLMNGQVRVGYVEGN
jgi:type I restriction enzyme S subunit